MPIALKPGQVKVKDSSGNYTNINILAEASTQDYLDAIEEKGEQTKASIPEDYTALSETVDELDGELPTIFSNDTKELLLSLLENVLYKSDVTNILENLKKKHQIYQNMILRL